MSELTRDGYVEAASIVERLADSIDPGRAPEGAYVAKKEREALRVAASLLRSHATRPEPPVQVYAVEPQTQATQELTRAVKNLTDCINRYAAHRR